MITHDAGHTQGAFSKLVTPAIQVLSLCRLIVFGKFTRNKRGMISVREKKQKQQAWSAFWDSSKSVQRCLVCHSNRPQSDHRFINRPRKHARITGKQPANRKPIPGSTDEDCVPSSCQYVPEYTRGKQPAANHQPRRKNPGIATNHSEFPRPHRSARYASTATATATMHACMNIYCGKGMIAPKFSNEIHLTTA